MAQSLPLITNKEITYGKEIGSGGFATVFMGKYNTYDVAIKKLRQSTLIGSFDDDFKREANVMSKLTHPGIVRLYGICTEPNHYALVLEYVSGGTLQSKLLSKDPVLWSQRANIAIDVTSGLIYLHKNKIIHRDLKAENILLTEKLSPKIADFGISVAKTTLKTSNVKDVKGTLPWMAPELLSNPPTLSAASDVYAYGMVLWEIAARRRPFPHINNNGLIAVWTLTGQRETIPKNTPTSYAKLIRQCWLPATKDRPQLTNALESLQNAVKSGEFPDLDRPAPPKIPPYQAGLKALFACNFEEARDYFHQAAHAQYPPAYLRLASLYEFSGKGGPMDKPQSNFWYNEAAKRFQWFNKEGTKKDGEAILNKAICYLLGIGVQINPKLALQELHTAADKYNYVEAQICLGWCYENGYAYTQNKQTGFQYFQKAAHQGHWLGQYHLALCYHKGIGVVANRSEAIKWYQISAKQGWAGALLQLGNCTLSGFGVQKDFKAAMNLITQAVFKGYSPAQCKLGDIFSKAEEYNAAFAAYKEAADQGDGEGLAELGMCYIHGRGVTAKPYYGVQLIMQSALQNNIVGNLYLGNCYRDGTYVPKSRTMAYACYRAAAEAGHVESMYQAGIVALDLQSMFSNIPIVSLIRFIKYKITNNRPRNAAYWFRLAIKNGHTGARDYLNRHGLQYFVREIDRESLNKRP